MAKDYTNVSYSYLLTVHLDLKTFVLLRTETEWEKTFFPGLQ